MKNLKIIVSTRWRTILTILVGGLLIGGLLWFQLGTLTSNEFAPIEINTLHEAGASSNFFNTTFYAFNSHGIRMLLDNSLFLPLKLPIFVLSHLGVNDVVALRSVASFYGLLSIVIIFSLMRRLFTKRIANIGAILVVTSSWFLQSSRIISPVVMYLFSMTLILLIVALLRVEKRQKLTATLITICLASVAYTPGFIILFLLLCFWQRKDALRIIKNIPKWFFVMLILAFFVLVSPLFYSMIYGNLGVVSYLGVPSIIEPIEWLKRLAFIPVYIFIRGPLEPTFNVARLPLLDVFSSVLMLLGVYSYTAKIKEQKNTRTTLTILIFSSVMIALNGPLLLPLLLPLVYLFIATGVALLLQQWFTVFPKNPLVRSLGVVLLCLALATISFYHCKRYFIVWPNAPATKTVFRI